MNDKTIVGCVVFIGIIIFLLVWKRQEKYALSLPPGDYQNTCIDAAIDENGTLSANCLFTPMYDPDPDVSILDLTEQQPMRIHTTLKNANTCPYVTNMKMPDGYSGILMCGRLYIDEKLVLIIICS
jgi:hypothetical protein